MTATWRGVAPCGDDPSLATANLRRSKALCRSLRFPSRAAMCTAWIFPWNDRSLNVSSSSQHLMISIVKWMKNLSHLETRCYPRSQLLGISGSLIPWLDELNEIDSKPQRRRYQARCLICQLTSRLKVISAQDQFNVISRLAERSFTFIKMNRERK